MRVGERMEGGREGEKKGKREKQKPSGQRLERQPDPPNRCRPFSLSQQL